MSIKLTVARCIYCATFQGHKHKGFCLTRIEHAAEEWEES
jgi:hypothetical protein